MVIVARECWAAESVSVSVSVSKHPIHQLTGTAVAEQLLLGALQHHSPGLIRTGRVPGGHCAVMNANIRPAIRVSVAVHEGEPPIGLPIAKF